jgi:hypothetical protein
LYLTHIFICLLLNSGVSHGKITGIFLDANFGNNKEKEYFEVRVCKLITVAGLQFALPGDFKAGAVCKIYFRIFHESVKTKVLTVFVLLTPRELTLATSVRSGQVNIYCVLPL